MLAYSRRNLAYAERYLEQLGSQSAAKTFCEIPYLLAVATAKVIEGGLPKLTRE